MQIKLTQEFENSFFHILEYIAQDKLSASNSFKLHILKQIKSLRNFPYKHRQSHYFEDENIRDMITKGYTIVYAINLKKDEIIILNIFNRNKPL